MLGYNPNLLTARYFKQKDNRGKRYYPAFRGVFGDMPFISRRYYRTATEAKLRAEAVLKRWRKLYSEREINVRKAKSIQDS